MAVNAVPAKFSTLPQTVVANDFVTYHTPVPYTCASIAPVYSISSLSPSSQTSTTVLDASSSPVALVTQRQPRGKRKWSNSERSKEYRRRKKEEMSLLSQNVLELRQQIHELNWIRNFRLSLMKPTSSSNIAVKLVEQYFHVFQNGMYDQRPSFGHNERTMTGKRQQAFLMTMANPSVMMGELVGLEQVLDQWYRYSTHHSSVRLEFVSMRLTDTAINDPAELILSAHGIIHLRYNRKTIEKLFPNVLQHEELVQRLIGKEIHLHCTHDFYFNDEDQVWRYDVAADYVTALLEVLGSIEDVVLMLDNACINDGAILEGQSSQLETSESCRNKEEDMIQNTQSAMNMNFILS